MFDIKNFLNKFKGQIEEGSLNILNILDILKKETGIDFKKDDLEIKNGVLFIKTTPIKKNIIFIKKNDLLKVFSSFSIFDIR